MPFGEFSIGRNLCIAFVIHAEVAGVIDLTRRCQNSQQHGSEHGRQQRYTDVDVLALSHTDTEMTVLRQTALGNIEVPP